MAKSREYYLNKYKDYFGPTSDVDLKWFIGLVELQAEIALEMPLTEEDFADMMRVTSGSTVPDTLEEMVRGE